MKDVNFNQKQLFDNYKIIVQLRVVQMIKEPKE